VQFEEESFSAIMFRSCVLFVLLLVLLIGTTGKADPEFLTATERDLIDHTEYRGTLFVETEQFSRYRDPRAATTFERGKGEVVSIANRGKAQAYLVSRELLYVIQHQTFDPLSLAEKNTK
jgi:hypothetical protein